MWTSVGNCALQQERWSWSFLRSYLGTSGYVPDYEYNVGGHYLSRYVYYYLGGRGRGHFGASDASAYFPCLKHRSIRIVRAEFGVEERKCIIKGGWAPAEAVFGRAAITAEASLYTVRRLVDVRLRREGAP